MTLKNPKNVPPGPQAGRRRLFRRFRNLNIILFIMAFGIMTLVMLTAFNQVIIKISTEFAGRYASSSANALSAHIAKQLGLVAKAARSEAVTEWMANEDNFDKKVLAHEELAGIIGELYSGNLYASLEKSRHEYRIEENVLPENFRPFAVLEENKAEDAWFFECLAASGDYLLGVAMDHVLQKKRVWIDHKVVQNGLTLGVLSSGLEFSHVAGELFSQYGGHNMRGLIVDQNGVIYIDSSLMHDEEFIYSDFETHLEKEFSDPALLAAIRSHLRSSEGYFQAAGEPAVMELPAGPYRYLTVAPIRFTNWSAVILYDSSSLINMSLFVPISITLLFLLIVFALAVNAASYRLIFLPLGKLESSLPRLKENQEERLYGTDRDDELGALSNTIQDLFTKANRDALTGIYNRRFMENNFQQVMEFLSRTNDTLSVLMLDVDFFKKYNDAYGHDQGDACLKAVARALAGGAARANDFAARYGGEEFVIVLPHTDEAGVRAIAEKLLESIRGLKLPHADSLAAPYVTVSIGVTTGKVTYSQNWEDYVKRADEALYRSKEDGRNRYTYLDLE